MPRYRLTSPDGKIITVSGDHPPTQEDAARIFEEAAALQEKRDALTRPVELEAKKRSDAGYKQALGENLERIDPRLAGAVRVNDKAAAFAGAVPLALPLVVGAEAAAPTAVAVATHPITRMLALKALESGAIGAGAAGMLKFLRSFD